MKPAEKSKLLITMPRSLHRDLKLAATLRSTSMTALVLNAVQKTIGKSSSAPEKA